MRHPQMATPRRRGVPTVPTRAWHAARMVRGRRRRREDELAQQDTFRTARRFMHDDVTALGEQGAAACRHRGGGPRPRGRNHCQQAIEHYDRAKHLLSTSTTAEEVIDLEQVVADARWHRAAVLALHDGEPTPNGGRPASSTPTTDRPRRTLRGLLRRASRSPSPCAPQMRVGWPMVRRPRLVWCGSRTDTCRGTRSAVWQGSSGTLEAFSGRRPRPTRGATPTSPAIPASTALRASVAATATP